MRTRLEATQQWLEKVRKMHKGDYEMGAGIEVAKGIITLIARQDIEEMLETISLSPDDMESEGIDDDTHDANIILRALYGLSVELKKTNEVESNFRLN